VCVCVFCFFLRVFGFDLVQAAAAPAGLLGACEQKLHDRGQQEEAEIRATF